jgi:hypothetical protein
MRRGKWFAALVGLVAVAAVGAFVVWPRPNWVTAENFDRFNEGIGPADVEGISGAQRDYRCGPTYPDISPQPNGEWPPKWAPGAGLRRFRSQRSCRPRSRHS